MTRDALQNEINLWIHRYGTRRQFATTFETEAYVLLARAHGLLAPPTFEAKTDQNLPQNECAGPFVSAFDCPVHDPRKRVVR